MKTINGKVREKAVQSIGEMYDWLTSLAYEGITLQRFKGLGEMSAAELGETALNPDTRCLLPISWGEVDKAQTESVMTMLMGHKESGARRTWLERYGDRARADI